MLVGGIDHLEDDNAGQAKHQVPEYRGDHGIGEVLRQ